MFKIGQSIFRRPSPTVNQTAASDAIQVENVRADVVENVSGTTSIVPTTVEIQQPARQIVAEPVTSRVQVIEAVAAQIPPVVPTAAAVVEQPAIVSRTTGLSAIELPIAQQIVVEPRIVIPARQQTTRFFDIPTETFIQQQPVTQVVIEERVQQPQQQVFQIVSVPTAATFIQQTPIIRTTTAHHLDQFFRDFSINGNVAKTFQFIGNAGLTGLNRNYVL